MCTTTCVIQIYIQHCITCVNMCITHVSATHVIHLYLYTCNIHKTPHMYYMYSLTGQVVYERLVLVVHIRKPELEQQRL